MPVTGLSGAGGGPFAGTFGSNIKSFVYTPTILSPTGSLVLNPVTLTASDFASEGLVKVHVSSDWQIATDSNFSNVVKSTTNDTVNKTSWSPSGDLDLGTTYYARVRYTGGPKELTSEWSATHSFSMMAVPVVSWVSDTPSSWNPTAGDSRTFNATATDTANPGGTHNNYTYQWYRNGGSPVSGYTGQTFNFYNPCYYSDNGNNLYCRVTITNAVGSTSSNSTTCSHQCDTQCSGVRKLLGLMLTSLVAVVNLAVVLISGVNGRCLHRKMEYNSMKSAEFLGILINHSEQEQDPEDVLMVIN